MKIAFLFTEINTKHYKAWFELGQIYEQLKLPFFARLYFAHAHKLRPKDGYILLALGDMFEETGRIFESLTCYYKALQCDTDGTCLLRIGKYVDNMIF